jgi:hypothetical protein
MTNSNSFSIFNIYQYTIRNRKIGLSMYGTYMYSRYSEHIKCCQMPINNFEKIPGFHQTKYVFYIGSVYATENIIRKKYCSYYGGM